MLVDTNKKEVIISTIKKRAKKDEKENSKVYNRVRLYGLTV